MKVFFLGFQQQQQTKQNNHIIGKPHSYALVTCSGSPFHCLDQGLVSKSAHKLKIGQFFFHLWAVENKQEVFCELVGQQRLCRRSRDCFFQFQLDSLSTFPAPISCPYVCFSSSIKIFHTKCLQQSVRAVIVLLDCFNRKGNTFKIKIYEKVLTPGLFKFAFFLVIFKG